MNIYILAKIISTIVIVVLVLDVIKSFYNIRKNRKARGSRKMAYIKLAVTILITCIVFVLTYVVSIIHVEGKSMEPNYKDNQFVLLNILNRDYKPGDVIVFYCPNRGKNLIKRVIATDGDTVEVKDLMIYVNSTLCKENYNTIAFQNDFQKVTVPKGKIFVMGDNRPISLDSRYTEVGFINPSNIEGKVILFNDKKNS